MKKLHVTLNGTNTLMMHSPKTVNPLHPLALELKKYTSKRKKTEDDLRIISELEWEAGLYYDDENGLHIPTECLQKTLENGAKLFKAGKDIQRYVIFPCEDEARHEVFRRSRRGCHESEGNPHSSPLRCVALRVRHSV